MVSALEPKVRGRIITRTRLIHEDVLKNRSRSRFLRDLRRQRIRGVSRRAKNAVFDLGSHRLVIQPGMTGSFHTASAADHDPDYVVLSMTLDDHRRLVYRDVRRLGRVYLFEPEEWERFSARIGPEPLSPDLTAKGFGETLRRSRQAIKKVIMDQRRLAGVGNIYANEALFRARIDPSRPTNRLTHDDRKRLYRAVRHVLRQAVRAGGTTVRDYRDGTGAPGTYQRTLLVYGRGGLPCPRCGTTLSTTHAIDGRATTLCWRCQGATP